MPTEDITIEDLVNWYCEYYNIELWKDIPGYEGIYQVSNLGRVRSLERVVQSGRGFGNHIIPGQILKPEKSKPGYLFVILSKKHSRKMYLVHRLVAQAFVPNPHNYQQVNHIDEMKASNNAANLEWCDCKFNINWGTGIERCAKARAKSVHQFTLGGDFVAEYWSANEAARQTGYDQSNISACCRGKLKQAYGYIWKYKKEGA